MNRFSAFFSQNLDTSRVHMHGSCLELLELTPSASQPVGSSANITTAIRVLSTRRSVWKACVWFCKGVGCWVWSLRWYWCWVRSLSWAGI
mmetsp:Transcript_7916/g.10347  ORF Transcript_7916/g.10347 Transcript_7916/m.10347 type:complete len:90 (+) Transcript_7916:801-1070(+)